MKKHSESLIKLVGSCSGLILEVIVLVGVGLVGVGEGQTPRTGRVTPRPAVTVVDRYAWQHGYRAGYTDGHTRGKSDFTDGNPRDFAGSEAYNNADRSYDESMGTRAEYREGYRLGFEIGYQDGYFGRAASSAIPANIGRIVIATINSASGVSPRDGVQAAGAAPVTPVSGSTGRSRGAVFVPADIEMKVRLTSTINTKSSREGDRFTAVVLDPGDYADGTVEGHISALKRSGKATGKTELSLAFDSLRHRDGRTLRLAGQVVRVYESETVKTVDAEGNVQSGSRTKDTATRGAGGAAIGAIIGAIAGGGKGAAIGAVIGAGAGLGSVYVQGDRDLILDPGTEILIRTAAPESANPRP